MKISLVLKLLGLISVAQAVDPLVDLTYAQYQGQTLQNGVNQWLALRFAAPPTGNLRFAAPQPPLTENATQDATKEGTLCVSANNPEGPQFGSARQQMAEDCLFLAVYAPLNATQNSKLPIMFFIQGGGFTQNSNGNFNGTGLVEASGMNMIVVRINYRVGILGFIAGTTVNADTNGAVPNNGLNDIIAAARWVKQFATKFGGNPDHIVLSGDSSGGHAIDILLTANNGTGFPNLFVGAAAESTGWGSEPYAVGRDPAFANNVNSTGCFGTPDPLDCMRLLPIAEFQNKTTRDGWGPTIDDKFLVAPHYQMMEQGRFQKIPVIYGSTSNEGTPSFISNQSASTDADISNNLKGKVPSITDTQLQNMMSAYPASLNQVSFFGRDVSAKNETLRKGSGPQWQRDAAIYTEVKLQCVSAFFSDMHAMQQNPANYHYRYNVLDTTPGGLADQGLFTPHTSELYAIWGTNNTDGSDPKCFTLDPASNSSCAPAVSIVQSYWISFVRTLDPNALRLPGSPTWETWTIESPQRIVFDNAAATMETVGSEAPVAGMNQRQRCTALSLPLAKAINQGLKASETLLPFANGTAQDPTISSTNSTVNTTNIPSSMKRTQSTSNETSTTSTMSGQSGANNTNATGQAPRFTGVPLINSAIGVASCPWMPIMMAGLLVLTL